MDLLGFVKGSPAKRPALNGLVHVSGGTGDTSFHGYMMLHEAEQFLKKWYSEPVFDEHADHKLQRPCHTTILMVAIRPVVVLIISDYHHSDHLDQKASAS